MKEQYYNLNFNLLITILILVLLLQSCDNKVSLSPSTNTDHISSSLTEDTKLVIKENAPIISTTIPTELLQVTVPNSNMQQRTYVHNNRGEKEEVKNEPVLDKGKQEEKNNKEDTILYLPKPESTNKHTIKNQQDKHLGNLDALPTEILELILLYMTGDEIKSIRRVNKSFYQLTTGYSQPGLIGLEHRPLHSINLEACAINKSISLKKFNPQAFRSFPFYQFIRQVCNFPKEFWPYLLDSNINIIRLNDNPNTPIEKEEVLQFVSYLKGSKVHMINLSYNQLDPEGATELAKNLQGTLVHTVDLSHNQMGFEGVGTFIKNLKDTRVHTVNISTNQIGDKGAEEVGNNLHGTQVHTINLSNNYIGPEGAENFSKHLSATNVHTINLGTNQIGAIGAVKLAKNLHGTQVHTVNLEDNKIGIEREEMLGELARNLQNTLVHTINLSLNSIQDKGIEEFAKYLHTTNIQTINLSNNQINAKGVVKFAKCLIGTNVQIINLQYNEVGSVGATEFAKHLKGTLVQEVDLSFNRIRGNVPDLLKKKYPHIKWKL